MTLCVFPDQRMSISGLKVFLSVGGLSIQFFRVHFHKYHQEIIFCPATEEDFRVFSSFFAEISPDKYVF